jgi:hypothetical protein
VKERGKEFFFVFGLAALMTAVAGGFGGLLQPT